VISLKARYLIDVDGKTVASATVLQLRSRYLVRMIFVAPEHQGKGYGSRLLREICRDADREGVTLRLYVDASAYSAPRLSSEELAAWYQRHGFRGSLGPRHMIRRPRSPPAGRRFPTFEAAASLRRRHCHRHRV
jgi:GNAT superfamily N-acetyltransferase